MLQHRFRHRFPRRSLPPPRRFRSSRYPLRRSLPFFLPLGPLRLRLLRLSFFEAMIEDDDDDDVVVLVVLVASLALMNSPQLPSRSSSSSFPEAAEAEAVVVVVEVLRSSVSAQKKSLPSLFYRPPPPPFDVPPFFQSVKVFCLVATKSLKMRTNNNKCPSSLSNEDTK